MIHVLRHALVLAMASGLLACGIPADPSPPLESPSGHWHSDPGSLERSRRWHGGSTWHLPEVRHARRDRGDPDVPRFVLNVLRSGDFKFMGITWPSATGTDKERADSALALRTQTAQFASDPDFKSEVGDSRIPLLLHAHRSTPWTAVRDLIALRFTVDPPGPEFRFAVSCPSGVDEAEIWAGRVESLAVNHDALSPSAQDVRLQSKAEAGGVHVSIAWNETAFVVPHVERGLDDPALVRDANEGWAALETALGSFDGPDPIARLTIDVGEGAPLEWAYVVKTIDLLMGAGVREFHLVREGWRVVLRDPEPIHPPAEPSSDPLSGPVLVFACALAILVAFVLTLGRAGSRRRDSLRRRHRES